MSHIFISYSHQDTDYSHKLAQTLEEENFPVWIDKRIDYGLEWPRVIQENLDNCGAFIVIMSPRSYQSKWVQNELSRAQRKRKFILPILIEGEPWLQLETTQHIDARGGELPSTDFYQQLSAYVPRQSVKEIVRVYTVKIQTSIDHIAQFLSDYVTMVENLASHLQSINNTLQARNAIAIGDTYYQHLSNNLLIIAKEINSNLSDLQRDWESLNLNVFSILSLTSFQITNLSEFTLRLNKIKDSNNKITTSIRSNRDKLISIKKLSQDKSGNLSRSIQIAVAALDDLILILKQGDTYLIHLIDLAEEKSGTDEIIYDLNRRSNKAFNKQSITLKPHNEVKLTNPINFEHYIKKTKTISHKKALIGLVIGAVFGFITDSIGLQIDFSADIPGILFFGGIGLVIGYLVSFLGSTQAAKAGIVIAQLLGFLMELVGVSSIGHGIAAVWSFILYIGVLGIIGWFIGRLISFIIWAIRKP